MVAAEWQLGRLGHELNFREFEVAAQSDKWEYATQLLRVQGCCEIGYLRARARFEATDL
jgi:hypothetical protein